ncbi:FAD-binding oxidoreductase [Albimonas sp. CAU 1670]|uniref:NAD(P)/FAD-dependent oxidoreductase n=1 Tax=Albimonas sp. CAU 1670 TaxID=3032599 RepID=UPI0023D9E6B3|nr:FAD-binding oxidoreductase [Albimonas sp. CAU 1670]MDF2233936.1 FAD-binding oxidoreductase [Albimonas sp. CAU 1670]
MIHDEHPAIANSLWTATAPTPPERPALEGEVEADVVVVGGGFSGLSAALHAAEAGLSVVVLEAMTPGWGASGRNGGQVNPGLKEDPEAVVARFGEDMGGRFVRLAGDDADYLFALVERLGIDCDPQRGGFVQTALNAAGLGPLRERARQWQALDRPVRAIGRDEIAELLGFDAYAGGVVHETGGTVQPLKLALGLAAAAEAAGARIFARSRATAIEPQGERVVVRTAAGSATGRRALVCLNGYGDGVHDPLRRSVVPVRSVQVATEVLPRNLRDTLMPKGHHASDTQRLTTYFRLSPEGRFVIGGRGRFDDARVGGDQAALRAIACRMIPDLADFAWPYAWGGSVAMTLDHFPHLHLLAPNVLSSGGFNGRGVALTTAMGRVLAEWAGGKPAEALDAPVTPLRPIPFHGLRGIGIWATIQKYRLMDRLGI